MLLLTFHGDPKRCQQEQRRCQKPLMEYTSLERLYRRLGAYRKACLPPALLSLSNGPEEMGNKKQVTTTKDIIGQLGVKKIGELGITLCKNGKRTTFNLFLT